MSRVMLSIALVLVCSTSAGCGEEGRGTLAVEIWGEEFIEEGIPAEVFADGWAVTFDRFLVVVDDVTVARGSEAPDIEDGTQRVFDLTEPGPLPFLTREVPAGRYDDTSYRLGPAGAEATAGNASADELSLVQDEGYAVYAEGTAVKGEVTKTFAWGFDRETAYTECHSEALLSNGDSATVQLTIHADHLFYDDLFSDEPNVTFDVIAEADVDEDGAVTAEELEGYDITALPNYGTGSEEVDDLWGFLGHLIGTLGHIDGEGHCHSVDHQH